MADRPSRAQSARDRAADVLTRTYHGEHIAHDLLQEMQQAAPLSPADERLTAELVIGVLRRRLTCEHIASRFYRGRWAGLREAQRVVLALGAYQLCMLDRVPDHAAVDQTVRQAKRFGRGFGDTANAILRKIIACRGEVTQGALQHEAYPRRMLALDGAKVRHFSEDIFPDPSRRPLEFLIAATGTPSWLVERWHRRFKPKLARQVCDAGWRRPVLALRPNRLRITATMLAKQLAADGLEPQLVHPPGDAGRGDDRDQATVVLRDSPPAASLAAVREGRCQPQDATARVALQIAGLVPGQFVLDLCAGVGTKSTQAAELMSDRGLVLATDLRAEKLEHADESARRLGLSIVRTCRLEELEERIAADGRRPDVILLDAPCLNSGVLARRPEARYRAGQKSLMEVCEIQAALLRRAAALAGPVTRIVYSTCSLELEENEGQVRAFCEGVPGWRIAQEQFTLPGDDRDGGFAAILVRDDTSDRAV